MFLKNRLVELKRKAQLKKISFKIIGLLTKYTVNDIFRYFFIRSKSGSSLRRARWQSDMWNAKKYLAWPNSERIGHIGKFYNSWTDLEVLKNKKLKQFGLHWIICHGSNWFNINITVTVVTALSQLRLYLPYRFMPYV